MILTALQINHALMGGVGVGVVGGLRQLNCVVQ
jgi:hypothetical protein